MSQTITAKEIRSGTGIDKIAVADLPGGTSIEVVIPGPLCMEITTATQSFLIQSMVISQNMGGIALLPVTRLGPLGQENDRVLMIQTDNLGAIGFQLTPFQWKNLREIAEQIQPGSQGIH